MDRIEEIIFGWLVEATDSFGFCAMITNFDRQYMVNRRHTFAYSIAFDLHSNGDDVPRTPPLSLENGDWCV